MRVRIADLRTFVPELTGKPDELAEQLTALGFEAIVESRELLDISFTPNRGDAMSALGLARDLVAKLRTSNQSVELPAVSGVNLIEKLPLAATPKLTVDAPGGVIAYEAVVFEDVVIQESPSWLATAVTSLGWRSINNLVDLTNYLMELYGQPLHAFDLDAVLGQQLTIRSSAAGEQVRTLDGTERTLAEGALVIADRDELIDLAGVMGGANSQVNAHTRRVLLQAAVFDPSAIRRNAQQTGLRTQAAIRYERGVDPGLARPVLNEALRLLKKAQMGKARAVAQLRYDAPARKASAITVASKRVNLLLGFATSAKEQRRRLEAIGCTVTISGDTLTVMPPSWRYDLKIWQDAAEEIARLGGLNDELPATPLAKAKPTDDQSLVEWAEALKDRLIGLGLNEVLTYSFTSKALLDVFELPVVGELANPLNPTLRYLRPSLLPNLANVAAANQLFDPILIFEIGHVFTLNHEEERLAIGIIGKSEPTTAWLARLADQIGIDSSVLAEHAVVTELTEAQRASLKIRKGRASFIEIRLSDLQAARRVSHQFELPSGTISYHAVSRYPAVNRDVALLVPVQLLADEISGLAKTFDRWIESVELFDEFQSDKLGKDTKSVAFHIRYADETRTLTEAEVSELHTRLVQAIERTFNAKLR